MNIKDWRNLRLKENKTEQEELLLEFRYALVSISEIILSDAKIELTDTQALEEIEEILDNILYKL